MSVDISPEVIKFTQESLGEFVKKPALSDKLLKKPPFRFLHDIITAVQKSTGFFDGLFTEEELVSDNVKDRESKIAFLNKVIDVVNIVTDSSLAVKSSKIIAGLEPEKTNELLQQLGVALRQNNKSKNIADNVVSTKSVKKTNKAISNGKIKETSPKDIKSEGNKKRAENKVKNSSLNKVKVKSNDGKISKDKGKLDTASDSDKASVKSNKSDVTKKPKVKEKSTTKLKASKSVEKPAANRSSNKLINQISNDSQDILPPESYGKKVELTDILDSDDLNSIEPEVVKTEPNEVPQNKVEKSEPPNKIITDEHNQEEPIKNNTVPRPQSRLSRQISGLTKVNGKPNTDQIENSNEEQINRKTVETAITNNVNSANGDKLTNQENHDLASDRGSGDSKTRSIRISSSKKSAKNRPEPLRATHNISIDSKDDIDISEKKSSVFESSVKQARPPSANLRPPSVRPSSARPGAPRLKEKNVDVIVTPSEPVVIGKVHVIVENYENQPEDDEGGVEVIQIAADDNLISGDNTDAKSESTSKGHGFLVQQILETQKELSHDETAKVQIEWEYGTRREREAAYKEIEGIRNGLQLLSRASNPLGKLMDYIQEDVEVMRQELLQWREARITAATELKQQQRLTDEQLQPLQAKLKQLENMINEQVELIYIIKSNIHRNTHKIIKLVDGDD